MKGSPYVIDRNQDICYAANATICDTHAVSKFFFWNLTNPLEFLAGTQPPELEEVGPFVMRGGKEKKNNVTFSGNGDSVVSFIATSYASWDPVSFCETCDLNDNIVSFNPGYYALIRKFGSEANFVHSVTPKVVAALIDGIAEVFRGIVEQGNAPQHIVDAVHAGRDAVHAIAVAQWGNASPLGGASVADYAPDLWPLGTPEFAIYASDLTNGSTDAIKLNLSEANGVFQLLTEDQTGISVLHMLAYPSFELAAKLGVSQTKAEMIRTYIGVHLKHSYNLNAVESSIGPLLGPESSGIFVKRTVEQWLMGFFDPLLSPRYPASDPRYLNRFITKNFLATDLQPDTYFERIPDDSIPRDQWPGIGATPWVLATGMDNPSRTFDVLQSTLGEEMIPNGTYRYPSTGRSIKIAGKKVSNAVYPEVKHKGLNAETVAWFDFGNSLDLARPVRLKYADDYENVHADVKFHKFHVHPDELIPCPTSKKNCDYNSRYHGAWDLTDHRVVPMTFTMPHGHRADPRMFGFINISDHACPFRPDAKAHEMEWDILKLTGNVVGMKLRYQNNFEVKPTDLFYPNLWQPGTFSNHDLSAAERLSRDGIYLPIAWVDVSWRVPASKVADIARAIADIKGAVLLYALGIPPICFLLISYSAGVLYIRRHIAKAKADMIMEHKAVTSKSLVALRGSDVAATSTGIKLSELDTSAECIPNKCIKQGRSILEAPSWSDTQGDKDLVDLPTVVVNLHGFKQG